MGTYAALSAEDQAIVQSTVQMIRGASGSVGRVFNTLTAIADDSNAIGLITSIDAGEIIPNESGMAGADSLTRAEVGSIWTDLTTMKSSHDTDGNRAAWSKSAGAPNLLGNG